MRPNLRSKLWWTKDGGKYGGFPEKLAAAEQLGASLIVVRRPEEQGLTQGELIQKLSKTLGGRIMKISIIGMGPG